MRETIKITNAALDELNGQILLRGVLDPASFIQVQTDDYQREALPLSSLESLIKALSISNQVPDITLGCRGGAYNEREGAFYLKDPTFVVDGLQRLTAGMHLMRTGKKMDPHLGCVVHFNTTRESERDLFRILNTSRVKLSPNVLIRNLRETVPAIDMLFGLTKDKSFVLNDRISWNQRMQRTELISALTYLKIAGSLHSSHGPGLGSRISDLAQGLQRIMTAVGRVTMRDNMKTFFDVMDMAWGIRRVTYGESAAYLKGTFMTSLALVFAHHKNFWVDNKLVVEMSLRKKIGLFPINDPVVQGLSGAHGLARTQLYNLMVQHINSGKRTKRLIPFKGADPMGMEDDVEDTEEQGEVAA